MGTQTFGRGAKRLCPNQITMQQGTFPFPRILISTTMLRLISSCWRWMLASEPWAAARHEFPEKCLLSAGLRRTYPALRGATSHCRRSHIGALDAIDNPRARAIATAVRRRGADSASPEGH